MSEKNGEERQAPLIALVIALDEVIESLRETREALDGILDAAGAKYE